MQSLLESAFRRLPPIIFRGELFGFIRDKYPVLVFTGY